MSLDLDVRVDVTQTISRGFDLAAAEIFRAVNDLSLQIRFFHNVEIDDTDSPDARCGQIHSHRRAEAARADHQYTRGFETTLPLHADFRHDQVTAVPQNLFV